MQFGAPTTPASSLITPGATGTNLPRMRQPPSIQQPICRQGEELLELWLEDQGVDHLDGLSQFSFSTPAELADLLVPELRIQLPGDLPPIIEARTALHPQPKLGARNLTGGGVFHQVEDSHRSRPLQPGVQVLERHADVVAHSCLGDRPAGDVDIEELVRLDMDLFAQALLLVSVWSKLLLEYFHCYRHQVRMSAPRPIEAVVRFADLVVARLGQSGFVDFRIFPAGNERRHPPKRMGASLVAGAYEKLGIGAHERDGHGDLDS